ncbi:MAG: tRNA (guanosine(37)-N1)-methyltransferase TrmD [Flavobacteriaceae bacterium]
MWRADVLTLFPDLFPGPLGASILGRGMENGIWALAATDIRDFATDRHRSVDDTPSGGGAGMVMRADILAAAIDAVSPEGDDRPRLLMSPRGVPFDQQAARDLAKAPGCVIVCGRFEGVDERVIEARGLKEVSLGDFVLAGGEVAAMAMIEASVRLLPGVLGAADSAMEESFEAGILEYPQYTRPAVFEGRTIPDVLTGGDHGAVRRWREAQALELTRKRRPDLLENRAKKKPSPIDKR